MGKYKYTQVQQIQIGKHKYTQIEMGKYKYTQIQQIQMDKHKYTQIHVYSTVINWKGTALHKNEKWRFVNIGTLCHVLCVLQRLNLALYWPVISSLISSLQKIWFFCSKWELVNTSYCKELIILDSANVYHTTLARRHDPMEYIGNTGVEKYAMEKYANGKVCNGINNIWKNVFPLTAGIWYVLGKTPGKVCEWKNMRRDQCYLKESFWRVTYCKF